MRGGVFGLKQFGGFGGGDVAREAFEQVGIAFVQAAKIEMVPGDNPGGAGDTHAGGAAVLVSDHLGQSDGFAGFQPFPTSASDAAGIGDGGGQGVVRVVESDGGWHGGCPLGVIGEPLRLGGGELINLFRI